MGQNKLSVDCLDQDQITHNVIYTVPGKVKVLKLKSFSGR